jgi:hypothetical protein
MRALIFGYLSKSLLSLERGRVREGVDLFSKKDCAIWHIL